MPELPEVETTRRSLAERLPGAEIRAATLGLPLRWPLGVHPASLVGLRIGEISRRGKYLWFPLSHPSGGRAGTPAGGLLLHLGMSGSLALLDTAEAGERGPYDHFELRTTQGVLRLTDPRRFGAVVWSASAEVDPAAKLLRGLGAEPFDTALTPEGFHTALKARRSSIKQVLLAGDIVVGVGNIYACEALFASGINPRLRADRLSRPRAARLLETIRTVLGRALAMGGTTLRDFKSPHGMEGAFQNEAQVYGREGLPCVRCVTPIRRVVMGQRSTYFCPACQKR